MLWQKSNVAGLKIFRENAKQRAIADSYDLNRVTEVACEFCVRPLDPSHLVHESRAQGLAEFWSSAKKLARFCEVLMAATDLLRVISSKSEDFTFSGAVRRRC
jgi:hypothetical protein